MSYPLQPIRSSAQVDEEIREEKWIRFEGECAEFAKSEPDGYAAVLRAVARAMKDQPR
jgi:hypothetical protein